MYNKEAVERFIKALYYPELLKKCSVSGCEETHYGRGFCNKHHRKWTRHGDPLYIREFKHNITGYEKGCRCSDCVRDRQRVDLINKKKRYSREPPEHGTPNAYWNYGCRCFECKKAAVGHNRKINMGLSIEKFNSLLDKQKGRCATCNLIFDLSDQRNIHTDHDHSCCKGNLSKGCCIRGLLCRGCNLGLGIIKESLFTLKNAENYILLPPKITFKSKRGSKIISCPSYSARLSAMKFQGERCLICYADFTTLLKSPSLDHDHECCPSAKKCGNCFRGFLCHSCNVFLGLTKENTDTIRGMIEYVNSF